MFAHGLLSMSGVLITYSSWGNAKLLGRTGKLEDIFKTVLDMIQHKFSISMNTKPN